MLSTEYSVEVGQKEETERKSKGKKKKREKSDGKEQNEEKEEETCLFTAYDSANFVEYLVSHLAEKCRS